jgi:hypothetical protein
MNGSLQYDLVGVFGDAAAGQKKPKGKSPSKRTVPLSIRVTEEEKSWLQEMAGALAISGYIRQCLFRDTAAKRAKRYQKKPRQPSMDVQEVGRLLGMFGRSELARSMLALSLAAGQGNLDVTPEVEDRIEIACEEIHIIKLALIFALGVKPQENRR